MHRFLKFFLGAFALTSITFVSPVFGQETVAFSGYPMGTIVIKTSERRLYYVVSTNEAVRFPVGVGRAGMQWTGTAIIEGKYIKPRWRGDRGPTIPGGSPQNPMGDAAMTMRGGEYAIHGTNDPASIGKFVSHGCIRMFNKDVRVLYRVVAVGMTEVVVLP